jgi:signal transduction histidine kinase
VAEGLTDVIGILREISHGIHPAVLSEAGLGSALRFLGRRSAIPVHLDLRVGGRLPVPVEVTAYYVVSEMLANAVKHAAATAIAVTAELADGSLRVCTRDDGIGGADPARGSGLVGLRDRVEAIGGSFAVNSPAGGGTTSWCVLPLTR